MRKVLEELLQEEEARKVSIHPFLCDKIAYLVALL